MIKRAEANKIWLDIYARRGSSWLPVLTGSMAPLICPGDQVLVSGVAPDSVRFGDILVFQRNGELIVHRVFRKWRNNGSLYFGEKGDSTYIYGTVGADKVVGRVDMVKGKNKRLSLSPRFSRLTNFLVSAWLYVTGVPVATLRSSQNKWTRRAGKLLYYIFAPLTSILIKLCFVFWRSSREALEETPGPERA